MEASRWQRVREAFEAASALPAAARVEFLANAGLDAESRIEVEALLAIDDRAGTDTLELARLAPDLVSRLDAEHQVDELQRWVGMRLGVWQLLRPLGQGGMGAVFLAERADGAYRQQAAVKLMRVGWDSGELLRRFAAERQILAELSHPNIARLLDGGSDEDGKPFLVIEYVAGKHLMEHCDAAGLSVQQRLRLFLDVCRAVAFAHARLVVHRDLKPSNILVDDQGQVKLLDFGIAKLLDGQPTVSAVRAFTPEYAAPEQLRGDAITTGVDIHALGLLLYELLTGRRAFANRGSTPAAYEQAILSQEPQRPSAAVTQNQQAVDSQTPSTVSKTLAQRLRGDLDAIVLKALRKEPEHRYLSVEAMASDIESHLAKRPVAARRGNWRYVTGRFLRRNALISVFGAAAAGSLLIGFGVALWQADVARQQRDAAERSAQTARAVSQFLSRTFAQADPLSTDGKDPRASEMLRAAARDIELATDLPDAERSAMYFAIAAAQLAREAPADGLVLMERALALAGDDPVARFNGEFGLANALNEQGQYERAEVQFQSARLWLDRHPDLPLSFRDELDYAQAVNRISVNRRDEAETMLRSVIDRLKARGESLNDRVFDATSMLVFLLGARQRGAEALAISSALYEAIRNDPRASLAKRKSVVAHQAYALMAAGNVAGAEPLFRETLSIDEQIYGVGHLQTLVSMNNLGINLSRQDRWDEAIAVLLRVLEIRRDKLSPGHTSIGDIQLSLGTIYEKAGRLEDGLASIDAGLKNHREAGAGTGFAARRAEFARARILHALGRHRAALDTLAPIVTELLGSPNYSGAPGNAIKLLDAELHWQLDIDRRACSIGEQLIEASTADTERVRAMAQRCNESGR